MTRIETTDTGINSRGSAYVWSSGKTWLDVGKGWSVEVHYYDDESLPRYLIGGPDGMSLDIYEMPEANESLARERLIAAACALRDHFATALFGGVNQEVGQ